MNHIIPLLVAFISTFGFIVICYEFGLSINLVDRPGNRKNHLGIVPLIGGIAVVFGFSLACLLSSGGLTEWRPLFFCMIPLVVVGPVTVELRLTPEDASLSLSPMML